MNGWMDGPVNGFIQWISGVMQSERDEKRGRGKGRFVVG